MSKTCLVNLCRSRVAWNSFFMVTFDVLFGSFLCSLSTVTYCRSSLLHMFLRLGKTGFCIHCSHHECILCFQGHMYLISPVHQLGLSCTFPSPFQNILLSSQDLHPVECDSATAFAQWLPCNYNFHYKLISDGNIFSLTNFSKFI